MFGGKKDFDFEAPLTHLRLDDLGGVHRRHLRRQQVSAGRLQGRAGGPQPALWWVLSVIISCGTVAGALIPEFTKIFVSTNSRHVKEVTNCSKHGGASLNILSGFVAGNMSAFWMGLVIMLLMFVSDHFSKNPALMALMPAKFAFAAPIFAFGLVAFGFLGMGPVTIAVDSYGPVTDNAQSVYELSQIEGIKNVKQQIKADFGFDADFENAKYQLEKGDGAGNTFKATAKPVLIGTAVVGATTMVFGIIMLLENMFGDVVTKLSIVQPEIILGLIMGGAVIYWFTGASCQAVVTGAYRAVVDIKEHMKLDATTASEKDSKEVVRIGTVYAQKGMWNIFIVIFCFALALPFFNPYFFIGYLIGIAFFGLFQAIFMANAGGAWDNAKKIVEVDMRQKGTELHAATVVGDTVGDPFKDTSSVAMNPVIKFTTLFGLLAVEIAVTMTNQSLKTGIGAVFFVIALFFVYRSFYGMRIPEEIPLDGRQPGCSITPSRWRWPARSNRPTRFLTYTRPPGGDPGGRCFFGKPPPPIKAGAGCAARAPGSRPQTAPRSRSPSLAHTGYPGELLRGCRIAPRHLAQRRIVQNEVGRQAALFRQFPAHLPQPFK